MHRIKLLVASISIIGCLSNCGSVEKSIEPPKQFEPTIESLQNYEAPEWFRDAKFGIYLHWGAYSVAERGEWYAKRLYEEGEKEYAHHVKTYGHPSEFGYKDFIPMWKAEKFDPDRLVKLFKRSGAKYFTPVAVHHDNFDLWNSKYHKWNAVNMGPKKDLIGMWKKAADENGLRWGVTTHLARSFSWFQKNKLADTKGPKKGVPYDGNNPEYQGLYHEYNDDMSSYYPDDPPDHWHESWKARLIDLIDNYDPDHMYFDGGLPFNDNEGKTGMEVIAHFYNQAMKRHGGKQEGFMCIKKNTNGAYFDGVSSLDLERTKADRLLDEPWQTDDTIGPWGYDAEAEYKSVNQVIDKLVDIVSKNGNLLLNVPIKADGTLDDRTEEILEGIGQWMDINGEAIYNTRPWKIFGEGTSAEPQGTWEDRAYAVQEYTGDDIRFTTKGENTMYVFALAYPEKELTVRCLSTRIPLFTKEIEKIELLGTDDEVSWNRDETGLHIDISGKKSGANAFVWKLTVQDIPMYSKRDQLKAK
jgi:alpha-L-fucosidase